MSISREFKESPVRQGVDEQVAYTLDTTPWGGTPAGLSVKLYDVTDDDAHVDVTSVNLSGSASANASTITTPLVTGLALGCKYRLEVLWTNSGNTFEAWGLIWAER